MPTPRNNESKKDFIKRCIPIMIAEGNKQDHAIAKCNGIWNQSVKESEGVLEDWEYLIHHIEYDDKGNEEVHHCFLYDHIANLFEIGHLLVKDGKCFLDGKQIKDGLFHAVIGLEPKQEVVYSDEEAKTAKIVPKRMISGMTLKQKAKEW